MSYNSNPLSFKFALEKFDNTYNEKNKKFLLIGDMLELGKYSRNLHIKYKIYKSIKSKQSFCLWEARKTHTKN